MPTAVRPLALACCLGLLGTTTQAQTRDACADLLTNANTHIVHDSGAERRIVLENTGCRLEARLRGEPVYTSDFRGIASLAAGGSFRLEEDAGRGTRALRRRLELESDGRGGIVADYREGREARPFDAAAQQWLADRLQLLYRRAGLAAAERSEWLLRSGGIEAVLSETALVQSSSGRAAYIAHVMRQPRLDDATLVRVLRDALPTSSSARTEILLPVAARRPLRGAVADAFLDAVAATSSTSRQRELLERSLQGGQADAAFVARVLRSAGRISSSSHRTALLETAAAEYRFDDELVTAYLETAGGISSSSGQRTALLALLSTQRLSEPQLVRTLRAVRGISSSTAQADVLVQVAQDRRLEGDLRSVYFDVARSISSSSQRARALEALGA